VNKKPANKDGTQEQEGVGDGKSKRNYHKENKTWISAIITPETPSPSTSGIVRYSQFQMCSQTVLSGRER
jgi:hypothetical protein